MATKEEIKKAKEAIKKTDEAIKADLKLSKSLQEFLEEDTSPEEAKRRVKMFIENPEKFRDLGTGVPIIKKAKGGVVKPKDKTKTEELEKDFEDFKPIKPFEPMKPMKLPEFKEIKGIKKAKGGSVLKEATDDRNRTPKRSICRGGGAAMKGVKFTGVK